MKYAILGDIHSDRDDLQSVIQHIRTIAPNASIVGTGDLFECTISKRFVDVKKYHSLEEVMILPEGFTELLTFPSVKGNQEERIIYITETTEPLYQKLMELPETLRVGKAEVIHGHQWKWGGEPWVIQERLVPERLTFFGHSHRSEFISNGERQKIEFGVTYDGTEPNLLVNVGAVKGDQEWVLYDDDSNTFTFYSAK